jgi:hypothetical protein
MVVIIEVVVIIIFFKANAHHLERMGQVSKILFHAFQEIQSMLSEVM